MAAAERRSFEILEHTADVGLRVRGRTLEELFEQAVLGMLEIMGARAREPGREETAEVDFRQDDLAGSLVGLLNEVIYLVDSARARVAAVRVSLGSGSVSATVRWASSPGAPDGTELKAATFHQLSVTRGEDGYEATVYFDA